MNDEKTNTALVPYGNDVNAQTQPDPVGLVNEFSTGYVNKTFNTAGKVSDAIGISAVAKQAGLSKYSNEWTPETTKNLLAGIGILMLISKFKTDGIPFLKANWKPVGIGAVALAYLLFLAKQKEAEEKRLIAEANARKVVRA